MRGQLLMFGRGPYTAALERRQRVREGCAGALTLARVAAGFTQAELARRSGVSRVKIARIEAGFRCAQFKDWRALREVLPELPDYFTAHRFKPEPQR